MTEYRSLIVAIFLSIATFGCSDDESKIAVAHITTNLSISSIDSGPVSDLEAHDELHIFYDLKVEGFNDIDLSIYFYALNTNELLNSERDENIAEMTHSYNLGNINLEHISEGNMTLAAILTIPPQMLGGDYKVIAVIDPHDVHQETIEGDNYPSEEHTEYAYTTIHVSELSENDFILEKVEFGANAIVLDIPETETEVTLNHSEIIGYIDAIYEGDADTEARLHASVYINGIWHTVDFWDSENQVYASSETIVFKHVDYTHHFGFDINFSHAILELIYAQYNGDILNSLQVKLEIQNPHAKQESATDNNVKVISIPYYFFDTSETFKSQNHTSTLSSEDEEEEVTTDLMADFGHTFGDKGKAAARLLVGAGLALNPFKKSISLKGDARLYSYIFNAESELLKAEAEKRYLLGTGRAQTNFYLYAFGDKVFQITNFDDESVLTKEWEQNENLAETSFFVGPVPMRVAAGVDGRIGYDIGFGFGYSELIDMNYSVTLTGKIIDDLDLNLFANGGINLAITTAGLEVSLKLIKESFILEMAAGLDSSNEAWSGVELGYGLSIKNEIDAISGRLGLFSEVEVPKFCKIWGAALPCGLKTNKYYLWLYHTDSVYQKKWTIYEASGSTNL